MIDGEKLVEIETRGESAKMALRIRQTLSAGEKLGSIVGLGVQFDDCPRLDVWFNSPEGKTIIVKALEELAVVLERRAVGEK